jgi:hypothetical protein
MLMTTRQLLPPGLAVHPRPLLRDLNVRPRAVPIDIANGLTVARAHSKPVGVVRPLGRYVANGVFTMAVSVVFCTGMMRL